MVNRTDEANNSFKRGRFAARLNSGVKAQAANVGFASFERQLSDASHVGSRSSPATCDLSRYEGSVGITQFIFVNCCV
jgi:hypothetical protein